LLTTPEDLRAEVLAGEIVSSPAPLPRHSKAQGAARRFLDGPFDDDDGRGGPGGWWIFVEVYIALGERDIVRPDLVGWRRERLPRPGATRPSDVVPDWACEVLSLSTAAGNRVTKRNLYARAGVHTTG
jgi:Uma2 family endonuclease